MKPRLSDRSKKILSTCHPDLQRLMNEVIEHFDFTVLSGQRTKGEQAALVARGASRTMNSKHTNNPSLAVDIAPYPIDWKDIARFAYLAGFVKMKAADLGIKVIWGGDWDNDTILSDNHFNDYGHFQLADTK